MAEPGDSLIWVYGVVDAQAEWAPTVTGVDGAPVQPIDSGALVALVSEVPRAGFDEQALRQRLEEMATLESLARAHDGVLDAALHEDVDVVPFRMCTLYGTPDSVRAMLEHDATPVAQALERVRGKSEWGVKAYLAERPAAGSPRETAHSGTEYLARRRQQRDAVEMSRQAVEAVAGELHTELARHAYDAVLSRPHSRDLSGSKAEMVFNGSYLVPREEDAPFHALFDRLRPDGAAAGLTLELSGPWPPYHFVAGGHA